MWSLIFGGWGGGPANTYSIKSQSHPSNQVPHVIMSRLDISAPSQQPPAGFKVPPQCHVSCGNMSKHDKNWDLNAILRVLWQCCTEVWTQFRFNVQTQETTTPMVCCIFFGVVDYIILNVSNKKNQDIHDFVREPSFTVLEIQSI